MPKESAEPGAELDPELVTEIEAQVQDLMAQNQIPGAAVGIIKDGEIVLRP